MRTRLLRSTAARATRRAAIISLPLTCALAGCFADVSRSPAAEPPPIVLSLSEGEAGIHYADLDTEEREAWGPSGLHVAADGTFWILDPVADRILHLDRAGERLGVVDLAGKAVGPVDVFARGAELYVLDRAAMIPRVLRLTQRGELIDSVQLPEAIEALPQGFVGSDRDRVWLSLGGTAVVEVRVVKAGSARGETETLALGPVQAFEHHGRVLDLAFPDAATDDAIGHELIVKIGDARRAVHTRAFVSSVALLRALADGSIVISMEEVSFDPSVLTDATIWHIAADGSVLGKAREPVNDQLVFVPRAVTVDEHGALFALQTERGGANVIALPWQDELEEILPDLIGDERAWLAHEDASATEMAADDGVGVTAQALGECRKRQSMIDDAFAYVNNWTWLSSRNLDRESTRCTGRSVPSYIATTGNTKKVNEPAGCRGVAPGAGYACIRSVPYDWGGWATVGAYATAMINGSQAGDTDKAAIEACSVGTDCSGFIGRIWKTPDFPRNDGSVQATRPTTSTLGRWSEPLSASNGHPACDGCINQRIPIAQGDILLKAGSHVSMFRSFGATVLEGGTAIGRYPFHFEATALRHYDRVSYAAWPWSKYGSYQPRRFSRVCE